MTKTIWPLIIISYYSLFVFGMSDNIRGPLFPEILNAFQVNDSIGSLMFSLSSIAGFISSHVIRFYLRKFDRLSILQFGCLGLFFALIGLSLSFHFYLFLFFSVLSGFTIGILGLIPNILVPLGSSENNKQQFLSGLHAMYGVASFIAPLMIAALALIFHSWRAIFAITAIFPLSLFFYSRHSSHKGLHQKPIQNRDEYKANRKKNTKAQIFLALMVSFSVAFEIMLSSRIALYMRRVWSFNLESSSLYVTYFFIAMLLARLLFTAVKFRGTIIFQLSICLLLSAFMLYLGLNHHPAFLIVAGFTVAPLYPMAITFISGEFPHDLDAAISYMIATDSIMLAFMHLSVGKLTDLFGINSAMNIGFIFISISLILLNSYSFLFKRQKLRKN